MAMLLGLAEYTSKGKPLTGHILSTDVASELEVHTDDEMVTCELRSREIAAWAGRKLSPAQLEEIVAKRLKGKRAFNQHTRTLFRSASCTEDEELQQLLDKRPYMSRLGLFRDALWVNVASALMDDDDSEKEPSQRISEYLDALAPLEEVAA